MNFLAHLFLSCDREELLVGNFLADFIRNKDVLDFPGPIVEGIILHRKIDSYTDNHPIVRQGVRRLYEHHSKYAPVIIDVFYDYFLSKNWSAYSDKPIRVFIREVYALLEKNLELMPEFLQPRVREMIAGDWLATYGTLEGIQYTFNRMRYRVSRPELLLGATQTMQQYEKELNKEFNLFFPDVIRYVKTECLC